MTLVFDLVKKAVLENYGGHFGSIIHRKKNLKLFPRELTKLPPLMTHNCTR